MGRITIFNTISAVILGAIGAGVTALFAKEYSHWGMFVGGILGFLFPYYLFGFIAWICDCIGRGKK